MFEVNCPNCQRLITLRLSDVDSYKDCPNCKKNLYLFVEGEDENFPEVEVVVNEF